jgi:hypothetical protein
MMETSHVAKLRDEKAAFPHAANNRVKALRQLFAWATSPEYGYAKKNPARDVGSLRSVNPDGIRAWTESEAARYEALGCRQARPADGALVWRDICRRQHGRSAKARLHRDKGRVADRQDSRTPDPAAATASTPRPSAIWFIW